MNQYQEMNKEQLIAIISNKSDRYGNLLVECLEMFNVNSLYDLTLEQIQEFIKMKGGEEKVFDLKAAREKKNLTQQELADKVGVVRQTISMIEMGKNKPSIELAKKIGKVLKFKWSNFFIE